MPSVTSFFKEPPTITKRFTVWPYYGVSDNEYYFTVQNNSLYRIEADMSGVNTYVVARDIGTEMAITDIDVEIKEFWENINGWSDITVIPEGNFNAANNNGPAWNAAAYMSDDLNIPYFNEQNTGINDLLQMGYGSQTINNNYNQNLPFATFWAVTDPVIVRYIYSDATYTRAVVNRVTPC